MKTQKLTLIALGASLNVVGAFIAIMIKFPFLMDSIGTILVAMILGPKYGVITGLLGSLSSGILFDPYSFYFAPVQISTGYICGLMHKKGYLEGKKIFLGVLMFAFPTALFSALIAGVVFGWQTSAGHAYIVQILSLMGASKVIIGVIVQILTEYPDKFLAVIISKLIISRIPRDIKSKFEKVNN